MEISIHCDFIHTFIPSRCRKPKHEHRVAEVIANIREVSGADAPVAIVRDRKVAKRSFSEGSAEYRWFGHRLWTAVKVRGTLNQTIGRKLGAGRFKSAEDAKSHIEEASKQLLVIDGVVHEETDEPIWAVRTFGMGWNHGGTALVEECATWAAGGVPFAFSLLEKDKAIAAARETAKERGDNKSLRGIGNKTALFKVLLPEAIRFDCAALVSKRLKCKIAQLEHEIAESAKQITSLEKEIETICKERAVPCKPQKFRSTKPASTQPSH